MGYYNHYSKWHNHRDAIYVNYMKARFRRVFEGHLPEDKEASILEVGCSNGMALATLKELGYSNVLGIELDSELAGIVVEQALPVLNQDALVFVKETNQKFDFIYMFDVLEHFPINKSQDFLNDVYNCLNDNGKLMMIVPNATSPAGSYFRYIDWTHATSFTPTSISYLLEEAGFKQITIMDESLIEQPVRENYQNEETYNHDKRQSDQARFYEAFARWEMVSMFGQSPYNLLVAPNMRVIACKTQSNEINLEILPSSKEQFDLGSLAVQINDLKQQLMNYTQQISVQQQHLIEDGQLLEVIENQLIEVKSQIENTEQDLQSKSIEIQEDMKWMKENIRVLNELVSENRSRTEENRKMIKLQSFELSQIKNQLEGFQHISQQAEDDHLRLKKVFLTIYKELGMKKRQNLCWKLNFKLRFPKLRNKIKGAHVFDVQYYLESYPDVKRSGMDPIYHYLVFGAYEGRNPSEQFDTNEYILEHLELLTSGLNPLIHKINILNKENLS